MKHPFNPSENNKIICSTCDRPYIDHTDAADCESCGKMGPCELNGQKKLLCASCYNIALDTLIIGADTRNKPYEPLPAKELTPQEIIEQSRQIDSSIRYNGDFYNAATIAIVELKKAIDNNSEIPAEEKNLVFQKELADRYYKLSQAVFELDSEKFKLVTEQLAIHNTLRDFGNDLRKEARERIRESDILYQPVAPKKIEKVVKREKKDPFETMVKAFAELHKITETEARIRLRDGKL